MRMNWFLSAVVSGTLAAMVVPSAGALLASRVLSVHAPVDVVHVKAAGRGHGIDVEFERGLVISALV